MNPSALNLSHHVKNWIVQKLILVCSCKLGTVFFINIAIEVHKEWCFGYPAQSVQWTQRRRHDGILPSFWGHQIGNRISFWKRAENAKHLYQRLMTNIQLVMPLLCMFARTGMSLLISSIVPWTSEKMSISKSLSCAIENEDLRVSRSTKKQTTFGVCLQLKNSKYEI